MTIREELLRDIEAFLKETRMSATAFGRDAVSDRALMSDLKAGRDLRSATIDRIRAFMRKIRSQRGRKAPRGKSRKRPLAEGCSAA